MNTFIKYFERLKEREELNFSDVKFSTLIIYWIVFIWFFDTETILVMTMISLGIIPMIIIFLMTLMPQVFITLMLWLGYFFLGVVTTLKKDHG